MAFASPMQRLQDWFTQQWVIIRGRKINTNVHAWLIGPFGNVGGIGEGFIEQLADKEGLKVERNVRSSGLITSIDLLNLTELERARLQPQVVDFYEKTARYQLSVVVDWNPFFRILGILTNKLFSDRLSQLHIPTRNTDESESVASEIITLVDPESEGIKYTFWFRKIESTGQVLYSGIYGTCDLPSGRTGIKAVFPLPNGNATVIMIPSVSSDGGLTLESAGHEFGDAGFYFLLRDASSNTWSQFVRSFQDRLVIRAENYSLVAEQTLTLWKRKVLVFRYRINEKSKPEIHR